MKEARFDLNDLTDQPITRGHRILKALQEKGWPVVGVLWPEYIEGGTMTVRVEGDPFFGGGEIVYCWDEG